MDTLHILLSKLELLDLQIQSKLISELTHHNGHHRAVKYEQICCNQEQLEKFHHGEWRSGLNNRHDVNDVLWAWCKITQETLQRQKNNEFVQVHHEPFESCLSLYMGDITAWLKSTAMFSNGEIWLRSTKWSVLEALRKPNQLNSPRTQVIKFGLKRESSGEVKTA